MQPAPLRPGPARVVGSRAGVADSGFKPQRFRSIQAAERPIREFPRLNIRPARVGDAPAIHELIRGFADRKIMLRRSLGELYESIREFLVAVDEHNRVVGCVALHVFWEDLAELKCLAVAEEYQRLGVGRQLVEACWEQARELEIDSVFALTYAVGFFERCGYDQIDKADLPHKIWNECVRCPLFPNCTETALIRSGAAKPAIEADAPETLELVGV